MNRMRKSFPKLYKHVPRTWVLPVDLASLKEFMVSKRGKAITLICKPTHMCQGRGIYLTKKIPEFEPDVNDESAANKMLVVQQYIAKPMLINNFKFDLRIYVAITSCLPHMRAFIHREGLTRFCTTPYEAPSNKNIDCSFMHLTNYAVNKKNTDFVQPSKGGGSSSSNADDEETRKPTDSGSTSPEQNSEEEDDDGGGSSSSRRNRPSSPPSPSSSSTTNHHHGPSYDFSDLPPMADISPEEAQELLQAQCGSKWSVTAMFAWLAERGHNTQKIWNKMQEVIALTLLPIMQLLQVCLYIYFSMSL